MNFGLEGVSHLAGRAGEVDGFCQHDVDYRSYNWALSRFLLPLMSKVAKKNQAPESQTRFPTRRNTVEVDCRKLLKISGYRRLLARNRKAKVQPGNIVKTYAEIEKQDGPKGRLPRPCRS